MGRARLVPINERATLIKTVSLPDELFIKANKLGQPRYLNFSQIVREALLDWIEKQKQERSDLEQEEETMSNSQFKYQRMLSHFENLEQQIEKYPNDPMVPNWTKWINQLIYELAILERGAM